MRHAVYDPVLTGVCLAGKAQDLAVVENPEAWLADKSTTQSALTEGVKANTGEEAHESTIFQPELVRTERYITAAVFLLSFAYLLLFRRFTTIEPDEGIVLQGAQRILHGEVLYRDFFSFVTPGSFYLQALLFKLFGSSFLVPRTMLALVGGIFAALDYLLIRRVCSRGIALLAVGLISLSTLPFRFLVLHNWDSSLFACLVVYCAVRSVECPRAIWGFALASFTSLTLLFEQSKGVGLVLGLCLGFGAVIIVRRGGPESGRVGLTSIAAGLAWPFVLTFAFFYHQHAVGAMVADLKWPFQHYTAANHVPYGFAGWSDDARHLIFETGPWWLRAMKTVVISPYFLIPILPLISVALFFYWVHRAWKGRGAKASYYVIVTGALSGLLLSIVAVRADIIHFVYLMPLYGLVLAWILDGRDIPGRIFKAIHPVVNACLIFAFLTFSIPLFLRAVNAPVKADTRRGTITMPAPDTALEYTQAHVAPGSKILVYPYLPLYYYFTGTFSPAPLDFFQPGMNTSEQGEAILRELASGGVSAVLFEPSFQEKIPTSWPGTPLGAIVRDPVADYILSHYRACRTLHSPEWKFLFMVRTEDACPLESAR